LLPVFQVSARGCTSIPSSTSIVAKLIDRKCKKRAHFLRENEDAGWGLRRQVFVDGASVDESKDLDFGPLFLHPSAFSTGLSDLAQRLKLT
jgi:hypothetical protein